MVKMNQYIEELIHLHDCVIIPGLGGLIANYVPARVDEETGMCTPPSKSIGFNKNLSHNDGLLFQHIVQRERLGYADAQQMVESFINDIFSTLSDNKRFSLGEIGELSKDKEGMIQFHPATNNSFMAESFGLTSFHITIPAHIKQINATEVPVKRFVSRALVNKGVAAGLILFAGLFLLNTELKNPRQVSTGALIPAVELIQSTLETDAPKTESDPSATDLNNSLSNINTNNYPYHLVVASFPNEADASAFCNKMISNGYSDAQVLSKNGKNRVVILHFSQKDEAIAALNDYRLRSGFESSWILKDLR